LRIISKKKLRLFWQIPANAEAEVPLRFWYGAVRKADWQTFADVRATFNTADLEAGSRKVIFDIGGNKYRLIAVIDFMRHIVFVRFVLTHKEYDKGTWKKDTFGDDWDKPGNPPAQPGRPRKRSRRKGK
jgi:mRNA interferase HigB